MSSGTSNSKPSSQFEANMRKLKELKIRFSLFLNDHAGRPSCVDLLNRKVFRVVLKYNPYHIPLEYRRQIK
jgi:hypothetical protein